MKIINLLLIFICIFLIAKWILIRVYIFGAFGLKNYKTFISIYKKHNANNVKKLLEVYFDENNITDIEEKKEIRTKIIKRIKL